MDNRTNYLNRAFDSIELLHKECFTIGTIFDEFKIPISAPCAANFRDSLFHYRKLYNSDFDVEFVAQYESIVEHANRSLKDSIVKLTQIFIGTINCLMKDIENTENRLEHVDLYMELYDYKNIFKQLQIELRAQGLEIVRFTDNESNMVETFSKIKKFVIFLKDKELYDNFLIYNEQSNLNSVS